MSMQELVAPTPVDSEPQDDIIHVYCGVCNPPGKHIWPIAMCGTRLTGRFVEVYEPTECVVCLDMEDKPCPECGS